MVTSVTRRQPTSHTINGGNEEAQTIKETNTEDTLAMAATAVIELASRVKGIKSNSELLEWPVLKMDFLEFYKELLAEFFSGSQLMGLQLLQLELRLGKTPSRIFRPLKSDENLWQIWTSYSLRVPFALD
ncbi:hypothetical protein Tco_0889400 [Tanacetum coccineum]